MSAEAGLKVRGGVALNTLSIRIRVNQKVSFAQPAMVLSIFIEAKGSNKRKHGQGNIRRRYNRRICWRL